MNNIGKNLNFRNKCIFAQIDAMRKNTTIFFYFLSIYVIAQFVWWGFHILDLTEELVGDTPRGNRRMIMIIGEGIVFLAILIFGIIRIRKSIKRELEFSRNQNNFLLSVTHELKTPIASTKLYLQTLQRRNIDEDKRQDILTKTLQQNEQLERLIDNILNATRLENKKLILHKEETNVSAFLNSIYDRYSRQYPGIVFRNEIQPDLMEQIDPFIFETIVNNLLENAIKYAGNEGKITVVLSKTDRMTVQVKDNGPGIPLADQKEVFKKFYRVGNEETRTQKGSGLGLFIARELTRLHKGQIRYYDNQPKGAVFEFVLNG
ncbi:HAMP domain-containing histidine kinase [Crocinitomicaceae bacterium CZZ-1]|uniref:histidine kinase n=1 Tax=Taishania pollutisoli TaxID=2766479 RepID=A0A8J6PFK1_9FLAO|nr:HAMP domain-containing sensor histidine kinase [Taishania pollutisoli]MBC9813490.1 HAMP domain-containing histidine kinase [Taishania pollutisoli]